METPQPPTESELDAQIVRRVRAGDVNAFALLVDRYHARVLRVATHLLGDCDDAEDVAQETFVRAYRHLGSYRERDRFAAWLMRIAVNQCRTQRTQARRWLGVDTLALSESETPSTHEPDHVEQAEQQLLLARALSQLAAAQREAIVLRYSDEMSYDEMAAITGVGVSALKMRVQRACAHLRALLSEHLHA